MEHVLELFREGQLSTKKYLADCQKILDGHRHGLSCFPWSWCRKMGKQVKRLTITVEELRLAIDGLQRNDHSPAIKFLDKKIKELYESDLAIARRWSRSPELTPMTVKCDPIGTRVAFKKMRAILVAPQL